MVATVEVGIISLRQEERRDAHDMFVTIEGLLDC